MFWYMGVFGEWKISPRRGDGNSVRAFIFERITPRMEDKSPKRGRKPCSSFFRLLSAIEWKISPRRGDGNSCTIINKSHIREWKISPRRGDGNHFVSVTFVITNTRMEDKSPKRGRKLFRLHMQENLYSRMEDKSPKRGRKL